MTAHTNLLSFKTSMLDFNKNNDVQRVVDVVYQVLNPFGYTHSPDSKSIIIKNGFLQLFINNIGSHAIVRGHPQNLLTLDLHEYVTDSTPVLLNPTIIKNIEKTINLKLECLKSESLPSIRRGDNIATYYPTVDGRLIELDFVDIIYANKSKYQDILVCESASLGNVLILDGDLNMGESDLIYTETLMQRGKIDYKDKKVLILGGGDGGVLHEVLKEEPSMVTMVEIDEMVVNVCRKHLRRVCYNTLDTLTGTNYEVIIGDAFEYLKSYMKKDVQFDFVLCDLTAIPVSLEPQAKEWELQMEIIKLSVRVLKERGRFLCHASAYLAQEGLKNFDALLGKFFNPTVEWKVHKAFIPTFHEVTAFYEIWSK